jgi:hypothetical protein
MVPARRGHHLYQQAKSGLFPEVRGTLSSTPNLRALRGRNRHADGVLIVSMIAMTLPEGYENHGREAIHSDGARHRANRIDRVRLG